MARTQVLIIGGGFAGLSAAQALSSKVDVILVDAGLDFEWQPNLHEIVSGLKRAQALQIPRAPLLERWGHRFVRARVLAVDPDNQRALLDNGQTLSYDVLMVAPGAARLTASLPQLSTHSVPLRTVADAEQIRARLQALEASGRPYHVVVMGGGFIGVELAGELLRSDAQLPSLKLHLVEGGERLMQGYPERIHRDVLKELTAASVDVRLNTRVASVEPEAVILENGERIAADLVVDGLGSAPPRLLAESGLAAPRQWAPTRPGLQSVRYDNVFILGDSAALPSPISKQAYQALKMGAVAAENVGRLLRGRSLKTFRPREEVYLITFGEMNTFFAYHGFAVADRSLSVGRELIFQQGMLTFDLPTAEAARQRLGDRVEDVMLRRVWPQLLRVAS
ncbi:MAG: FAD-dependent oxidoreductase [Myxococcota bacterium]